MAKKNGYQTVVLNEKISLSNVYSIAGPCEGQGPLRECFDIVLEDDLLGKESYEQAESAMIELGLCKLITKAGLKASDIDVVLGGDLINQIVPTSFAVKNMLIPYWGLYNACATFAEGLQIGALSLISGAMDKVIVTTSSHFSSSERQYRTPLELGSQAPAYSQRTVTGMGCVLLEKTDKPPFINSFTTGRIVDFDSVDPFDMGTAMAPAAADTILRHFKNTKTSFEDYDVVSTGDLANGGLQILTDILKMEGFSHHGKLTDCGELIYDRDVQKVNNGGSGAGCCSTVFAGYWFDKLKKNEINNMLFVPTGALLSSTTYQQKLTIPCIAHAISISNQ